MKARILFVVVFSFLFAGDSFGDTTNYSIVRDAVGVGYDNSLMYDDGTQVCVDYSIAAGASCPEADDIKFAINGYFSSTGLKAILDIHNENGYPSVYGGSNNECTGTPYPAVCDAVTIAGGRNNKANNFSFVGGGSYNYCYSGFSAIAGGYNNYLQEMASNSFIGGGYSNRIGYSSLLSSANMYSVIGGGYQNIIGPTSSDVSNYSVIVGGKGNEISGTSPYSAILGGYYNDATNDYAVVCGGINNRSDFLGFVGGGQGNQALSNRSTVSGGMYNTAGGSYSTVPGGYSNVASGEYSWAGGQDAEASFNNSFVWSDGNQTCYAPSAESFKVCSQRAYFTGYTYFDSAVTVDSYVWAAGNVYADDFVEFSPYPDSLETAYVAVISLERLPDGEYDPNDSHSQLNHEILSPFIQRTSPDGKLGLSIGALVAAQNEVIKDLTARNIQLEARLAKIEAALGIR